jgi:hypothetical protein
MHHFSRVNWSALNFLMLSNYFSMQMTTKLEIKDANTYQELDYTKLKTFLFVYNNIYRGLLYW